MQSVAALEAQLAEARNLIVEDEKRLGELRAAKAFDAMSDDETAELRIVRTRIRDRQDEIGDLQIALKVAEDFAASAAGQKRRDDAIETMQRVEAVGLALQQAAELEDAAGAAYERAMDRRTALQAALKAQAQSVLELLRPTSIDHERAAEQMGHLATAADGGIPVAAAWRIARLAGSTKGMIALGPGVSFDTRARLTVATAARSSLVGLLQRLAGVLQHAGIPVPEQGQEATREHAARIVAAMDDTPAAEAG